MVGIERNAKRLESENVHVDLAGAKVAATGHGNLGLTESAEQGAHHGSRRAHLGNQVIGSLI